MIRGWVILALLAVAGCAPPAVGPEPTATLYSEGDRTVWRQEYSFVTLPASWQLYDLNETELTLSFLQRRSSERGSAAISYAEEPFGHSRALRPRAQEFLKRYLWAARVDFDPPQYRERRWQGQPALELRVLGHEPVKRLQVQGRVVFVHRGERIVAFLLTRWLPEGQEFEPEADVVFDRFVDSFRFLRPSFYEEL